MISFTCISQFHFETMKKLKKTTRNDIVAHLMKGFSLREVAVKFKVGFSTVRRIGLENDISSSRKGGRRKKLSPREERICFKKIISGEEKSATALAKSLSEEKNIPFSRKTVAHEQSRSESWRKEKKTFVEQQKHQIKIGVRKETSRMDRRRLEKSNFLR